MTTPKFDHMLETLFSCSDENGELVIFGQHRIRVGVLLKGDDDRWRFLPDDGKEFTLFHLAGISTLLEGQGML